MFTVQDTNSTIQKCKYQNMGKIYQPYTGLDKSKDLYKYLCHEYWEFRKADKPTCRWIGFPVIAAILSLFLFYNIFKQ